MNESIRRFERDEQVQEDLLTALSDQVSREILRATSDQALTVTELSGALDLPISTVYRKLHRLTEASLLEETCRLAADGGHPSQYRCTLDRVQIELSPEDNTFTTSVHHRDSA